MANKLLYKIQTITLLISTLGICALAQAQKIEKCQDEEGNWHYGDFAAAECALSSDIITLSGTGTEVGTQKPPPTTEELEQVKAINQAEGKAKTDREAQRKLDQNLVQIYSSEENILSTRDRKLTSIDNNLEVTRQLKAGVQKDILDLMEREQTSEVLAMISERQLAIKSYDEVIANSLFERKKLENNYIEILQNFRKALARLAY